MWQKVKVGNWYFSLIYNPTARNSRVVIDSRATTSTWSGPADSITWVHNSFENGIALAFSSIFCLLFSWHAVAFSNFLFFVWLIPQIQYFGVISNIKRSRIYIFLLGVNRRFLSQGLRLNKLFQINLQRHCFSTAHTRLANNIKKKKPPLFGIKCILSRWTKVTYIYLDHARHSFSSKFISQ